MPAPPTDARSFTAPVSAVEPCGADGVLLSLRPRAPLPPLRAARFFMLRREDGLSPAIGRPFSLYRQTGGELQFLLKVTGRGTRALAACEPGRELRVIGPLGNGWPDLDGDGAPWVMLAGGIGSAPFFLAIEQALAGVGGTRPVAAEDVCLLYGASSEVFLYDLERFESLGVRVLAATDDGSRGFPGNVCELLEHEWEAGSLPREVRLLACGPDPMLRSVERLARERDLACWLSLEELMGCGVGICNGCPVPTRLEGPLGSWPNAKCCVEGPVFSTEEITLLAE
ncbi:MAG: dihydroorotate dehydrogenase electron transfer subunit [Planctomycetota bacterium]|nr:dihydroorotate dehydrogenase electron transfer subunit [Planctomycetota bacterium]